jgi:hypothetical protein
MFNIRTLVVTSLLMSVLFDASAQSIHPGLTASIKGTEDTLAALNKLADEAHKEGDIEAEIAHRRKFSALAWDHLAYLSPKSRWNRFSIVFLNDLPLGLLLEGNHQLSDAEMVYRHNQSQLAHERLAGNDIKSENELRLAHVLLVEGRDSDAKKICSHWEHRVKHNADYALFAVAHDTPTPPLYDTPEVETARWDLACDAPAEGLRILAEQIKAHPHMLASYTALSEYYTAEGRFQEAQKTENGGVSALVTP